MDINNTKREVLKGLFKLQSFTNDLIKFALNDEEETKYLDYVEGGRILAEFILKRDVFLYGTDIMVVDDDEEIYSISEDGELLRAEDPKYKVIYDYTRSKETRKLKSGRTKTRTIHHMNR